MTEDKYKNLSLLILNTNILYKRALSSLLKPYKLSILKVEALRLLNGTDSIVSLEFVKENLTRSGVDASRMINELKKNGLVTRTRSSRDRRGIHIKITAAGKTILNEVEKQSFENKLLNHLEENEMEQLKCILKKIVKK